MDASVWIVLVLLVGILTLMGSRLRGKSFDDMFADQEREHHHVHRVLARHPKGGDWPHFGPWMDEEG